LKVKSPFIQTIHRFDKRILEWDGLPGQIPTLDKRFIVLDTTARWRIVDPLRFFNPWVTSARPRVVWTT